METMFRKISSWLFLVGVLLAVIFGLVFGAGLWVDPNNYITLLLAILGFVVGVLTFLAIGNITHDKVPTFLLAALMLIGIGAVGSSTFFEQLRIIGPYFANISAMLAIFVAPAAGLLAIRAIWDAGKTEDIEKIIPKIK